MNFIRRRHLNLNACESLVSVRYSYLRARWVVLQFNTETVRVSRKVMSRARLVAVSAPWSPRNAALRILH